MESKQYYKLTKGQKFYYRVKSIGDRIVGMVGLVSLEEIAEKCDIITFHPTLNVEGAYCSYHLADTGFFDSLRRCRLFINASRGPVVDNRALLSALEDGRAGCAAHGKGIVFRRTRQIEHGIGYILFFTKIIGDLHLIFTHSGGLECVVRT